MKKILKWIGISIGALMLILLLIPVLFKNKILATVKSEINQSLNAKVDFKDVNLSLFRHFPKLSVALDHISVIGTGDFAKDTLIQAERIDVSLDLLSIFSGNEMKVHGIYLNTPQIKAFINDKGQANWDIVRSSIDEKSIDTSVSTFSMQLEKYEINNGYVTYNDALSNTHLEIEDLDHKGSGKFNSDAFLLSTSTQAGTANFSCNGIPYLINAKTGINADFDINQKTALYVFKEADISINNLRLSIEGFLQMLNDSSYKMDVAFKAPSTDFKDVLSLIPAIYKNDFNKIQTGGIATLKGFVKGIYSGNNLPSYSIDMQIRNGYFQYPDLPEKVKNIQLELQAYNPDGKADHAVLDIRKGHFEMGNEPFDFKLLYKNPETLQYIDAVIKGRLNLADITKFIKLDNKTKLSGEAFADAYAKGSLKAMQQNNTAFSAGGYFKISKLFYASADFPQPLKNGSLKIDIDNDGGVADQTKIQISDGYIEVGSDPLQFNLNITQPVTALNFDGKVKGKFSLDKVKQFIELEPGTHLNGLFDADLDFIGSKSAFDTKHYDKIDISGHVLASNLSYISKEYPTGIKVKTATIQLDPNKINLQQLAGSFLNTHFTINGTLKNALEYFNNNGALQGVINMEADKLNLNEWMGEETSEMTNAKKTPTNSGPFLVPSNIAVTINAKADEVKYDKVIYSNIKGTLFMNDETIHLQQIHANALDGNMAFTGSYSTRLNKQNPQIQLSYDIKEVDIQKTFLAFNTVQKLMPIGKFLAGKLSSQLSMNGKLDGTMMPEINSLSGNGSLLMLQGVLSKFLPLEKLADVLQVNELRGISIRDFKSQLEFSNGKVLLKPFDIKVKDIEMQIGGMHSLDQSMDYIINMKLPRKYLGSTGNSLVNGLTAKANSKGIPVSLGETVDLVIRMGGSITNPTVRTDLRQVAGDATKELKQQANDFVKQKVDSSRQLIKDTLSSVKKQVVTDLKNEVFRQITGNKDSTGIGNGAENTKKRTEETIKSTLGNLLNRKKKSVDTTKNQ